MRLASVSLIALAIVVFGCGGGGATRPGPLRHTLDEAHIVRVPMDQRPQVAQANNDFAMAKSEKLIAEDKVREAEDGVKLADNEVDQAILEERNAKVKLDSAKASGDQTRINTGEHEARAALLGRRAADAKLGWAKAKREYQKKWLRFTEFDVYAKEAKFELEKAKVAKGNNINPKGFAYQPFEDQYRQRSEAAQRAKADAERSKGDMVGKEKSWKAAEKEWNEFRGVKAMPEGGGPAGELPGASPTP